MIKLFYNSELVLYKRSYHCEEVFCVVLNQAFSDNGNVKYFKCLIENKIETICEIWLEKILYGKNKQ